MLQIDNIEFFGPNELCDGGITLQWFDPDKGFGEIVIYKENNSYFARTEYMGDEFMKQAFEGMIKKIEIIE